MRLRIPKEVPQQDELGSPSKLSWSTDVCAQALCVTYTYTITLAAVLCSLCSCT